jgi:hypothetical protein
MNSRNKHKNDGVTIADFPAWESRTRHTAGPSCRNQTGMSYRRILSTFEKDGVEYSLHATKGIRRARRTHAKVNENV